MKLLEKSIFAEQAGEIACWFFGNNSEGQVMYNPETGRCFDGITGTNDINKNSGAESTIEALLTLLAVEQYDAANKIVHKYYQQQIR